MLQEVRRRQRVVTTDYCEEELAKENQRDTVPNTLTSPILALVLVADILVLNVEGLPCESELAQQREGCVPAAVLL